MPTISYLRFNEWLIQADIKLSKAGVQNSRIDADYLLSYVTHIPRLHLSLHSNQILNKIQANKLEKLLNRRLNREPLQYILKTVDFHGLNLYVNKNVLIPRPETEFLVDMIIRENTKVATILDIGTGSGGIALALKQAYPDSCVTAVDISIPALRTAIANARRLKLPVRFHKSDVYDRVIGQYDLIVSNPPYLTSNEYLLTVPEIQQYEPKIALQAENNGLAVYVQILAKAREHLKSSGKIYLEIGHLQAEAISFLAQKNGFTSMEKRQDLNGFDRYFIIRM